MKLMFNLLLATLLFAVQGTVHAECIGNKTAIKPYTAGQYFIDRKCFTDHGWFPPVPANSQGMLSSNTHYDYQSDTYTANNKVDFTHGGIDLDGPSSAYTTTTPVYSIGNGKVSFVNRLDSTTLNLSAVVVEYEAGDGQKFSALYGHTFPDPGIEVGQYVVVGQKIGTLRKYGSPIHLHFSIYANYVWPAWRTTYGSDVSTTEPMQFLRDHYGALIPRSIVDGVGSLVDPRNGNQCATALGSFGCSKDIVRLHAHPNIASTAVFQTFTDANAGCDYLSISGLTKGFISVRKWNDTYPGSRNRVENNAWNPNHSVFYTSSFPVHVKVPAGFNLVSVTSTQPIPSGETRTITAECRSTGYVINPLTWTDIAPDVTVRSLYPDTMALHLRDGTFNGFYGGNGSLIEPSGNTTGFGRTVDYAKTRYPMASEMQFQVFATSKCTRVTFSSATAGEMTTVAFKYWDAAAWTNLGIMQLPLTLNMPANAYFLVRFRPSFLAMRDSVVARCQP